MKLTKNPLGFVTTMEPEQGRQFVLAAIGSERDVVVQAAQVRRSWNLGWDEEVITVTGVTDLGGKARITLGTKNQIDSWDLDVLGVEITPKTRSSLAHPPTRSARAGAPKPRNARPQRRPKASR